MPATPIKKPILANKLQDPKITLELDGKVWQIVCTHNVLCELEDATGKNFLTGIKPDDLSNKMFRSWLYLCLREQGATYNEHEVGELMTGKIHLVVKALTDAYQAAMPSKEQVDAEIPDPPRAIGQMS